MYRQNFNTYQKGPNLSRPIIGFHSNPSPSFKIYKLRLILRKNWKGFYTMIEYVSYSHSQIHHFNIWFERVWKPVLMVSFSTAFLPGNIGTSVTLILLSVHINDYDFHLFFCHCLAQTHNSFSPVSLVFRGKRNWRLYQVYLVVEVFSDPRAFPLLSNLLYNNTYWIIIMRLI